MDADDALGAGQIQVELARLPQWRHCLGALCTALVCESSTAALELFAGIGALAEEANHHPAVDWRYDTLFITLTSHDAGGRVTERDAAMARAISGRAEATGATARPDLLHVMEIAIDTPDAERISEVWRTALGYEEHANGNLVDPYGRGPAMWFQETPTPHENRFHLDVTVPFSESAAALDALGAAGAELDRENAPLWVVATDQQGNRLCISTEAGRDLG